MDRSIKHPSGPKVTTYKNRNEDIKPNTSVNVSHCKKKSQANWAETDQSRKRIDLKTLKTLEKLLAGSIKAVPGKITPSPNPHNHCQPLV